MLERNGCIRTDCVSFVTVQLRHSREGAPGPSAQPEQRLVERAKSAARRRGAASRRARVWTASTVDGFAARRPRARAGVPTGRPVRARSPRAAAPFGRSPPRGRRLRPAAPSRPRAAARNGTAPWRRARAPQRSSASAQVGVFVCIRDPIQQLAGEVAAERVEPRGLARRLGRRDRQHRTDPVGAPVRAGRRARARRRPPRRSPAAARDGVRELGRRVRRAVSAASGDVELEDANPVGLPAECRRQEACRGRATMPRALRPPTANAGSAAELDLAPGPEPDQRRDRCVSPSAPEERALEPVYARSKTASFQSKPPQCSATSVRSGSRTVRINAPLSLPSSPVCARGEDRRSWFAAQLLECGQRVRERREAAGPRFDVAADPRRYS
jgi:hypothetical protein